MYDHKRIGHVPHIRLLTWVLAAIFIYLMSSRVLPGNAFQQGKDDIHHRWDGFVASVRTIAQPIDDQEAPMVDTVDT